MKSIFTSVRRGTMLSLVAATIAFVPSMSAHASTNPTPPPPTRFDMGMMARVALMTVGLF